MVSGEAARGSSWNDRRKMHPARYCARTSAASIAAATFASTRTLLPLVGRGQAATLALRFIPNLPNEALIALHPKLNHHIDEQIQQVLNVAAGQLRTAAALLDEKHQLFERELGARRVHTGDRTRVPRVHVTEVIEGFFSPELGEQNSVRLHAQATLEELLRRHSGEALIVFRVEKTHVIRVLIEHEFLRILNRDQPLLRRDLPNERLGPGRLARARGARDQDVLP